MDKRQDKLTELRSLRNMYTEKAQEIQKEIDNIILESYDCNRFLNKYIRYINDDEITYMYVSDIERVFTGAHMHGHGFTISPVETMYIEGDDMSMTFKWDLIKYIEIIDKEEYTKQYFKTCEDIFNFSKNDEID